MTDVKMNLRTILYDNKKVSQITDEEQNQKQEQEELEVEEQESIEPGSVGINDREGSLFALEQKAMIASIGQNVTAAAKAEATMTEYEISGMKFSVSQVDSAAGFTYKIEDNRIIFTAYKCTINIDEVTNDKFEIEIFGSEVTFNSNVKVASITNNAAKSIINGSDEDDVIIDKSSKSIINAGKGNDIITSFGLTTTIHGGDGNDTITSTGAFSKVYGDNGKDNINASGANITVDLGEEKDTAYVEGQNIDITTNGGNSIVDGKGKNITVKSDADSTNKITLEGKDNKVENKSSTDHIEINGNTEQEGDIKEDSFDKYGIDDGKMHVNGEFLTGIGKDNKMYQDGEPLTGISIIDKRLYKGGIIDTKEQVFEGRLYSGGSLASGVKTFGDIVYINGIPQKLYDEEGYDKDGYDREGYNRQGYNKEGYDREGYKLNEDGSKTKHIYDNGKIVGDKIIAPDGSSTILAYNDKGETISKKSYNTRGQLTVYEEYKNGKTVSTTTYRKDGSISSYTKINDDNTSYTLLYDNDGKSPISRTDFTNDVIRKTTNYTNGNISKITVYDTSGKFQLQTEYSSDGSAKSYDVAHKLITGTINEITYANGEVDTDALYNTLINKGYVDADGKMLTNDMWKFLENSNLVDSEKNPIDKNAMTNLLARIELKPEHPDGFDEKTGALWIGGQLHTGDYENKLYKDGFPDTQDQVYSGNGKLYLNGSLATGTHDFEGKLYTDGNFDTKKQLYKNQLWNNGELSKGQDTFENKLYKNGTLDTEKQLYKNQLWNNGELSKGTDDFEGKLYTDGNFDTKKQLYKNQLWNNGELSKGQDTFENKLYKNGTLDTEKQLYKNQLWNNGELSKGTNDFEGKLYTNGDFDTKKQLYRNQLWNNGELSKGTDDFEGKLYTNGDFDTKKQLHKNRLWNNGELSKGTDDFEGKLYTNGDFDTKKQLYKNQLWNNGELSKGTDDFEGKLYTNGDFDTKKQLYKKQLWDNGELSKGKDEFEGLTYYNGDLANGDIGDEKYSGGKLIREKITNTDNSYTVNNYNTDGQKLSERNYDKSNNLKSMRFFEYDGESCTKTTEYNNITSSDGKLASYTEVENITGGTATTKEINIQERFNEAGVDRVIYTITNDEKTLYYVAQEPHISDINEDEATMIFAAKVTANGAINGKLYEAGELISPVKHEDGFWYSRGEKCDGEYPLADGSKSYFEAGILIKNTIENDEGTTITRYADNDDKKITSVTGFDKSNRVTLIKTFEDGVLSCTQNEFKYDTENVLTGFTETTEGETPSIKTYEILSRTMTGSGDGRNILLSVTENEKTYLYKAQNISELPTKTSTEPTAVTFNNVYEYTGIYDNAYYFYSGKTPEEYSRYMIFLDSIDYDYKYELEPNGFTKETAEFIDFSDEIKSDIDMLMTADTLAKVAKEAAIAKGENGEEAYQTTFNNSIESQMVKDYKTSTLSDDEILSETEVGDVIEKSDGIYVNDGETLCKLKMSKDKYLELFPPIRRYSTRQGGIGDCYFISSILSNCMKNSQTYPQILKMFNVDDSNNLTISFRGTLSDYPVTFPNGELYEYDGMIDGNPAEYTVYSQASGCSGIQYIEQAFALAAFADTYNTEISAVDIDAGFDHIWGGWQNKAINNIIQPELASMDFLNLRILSNEVIDSVTQEQIDSFVPVMSTFFSSKIDLMTYETELADEFDLSSAVINALSNITSYCGEIWANSYKEETADADAFRAYMENHYYWDQESKEIINSELNDEELCEIIRKINTSDVNYPNLRKECSHAESEFVDIIWDTFSEHNEITWLLFDVEETKESLTRFLNNTNEFGFKEALYKENEANIATLSTKLNSYADDVNSKRLILGADTSSADNSKYSVFGGHAYAIESIDTENQTLRIVNPWSCGVNIEIPYSEFAIYFNSIHIAYTSDVVATVDGTDKFGRFWKDGKTFTGEIDGKVYRKGILIKETITNPDSTTTVKLYNNDLKNHYITSERVLNEENTIISQKIYEYKNDTLQKITEQKDITYDITNNKISGFTEIITIGTDTQTNTINITDRFEREIPIFTNVKNTEKLSPEINVSCVVYTITTNGNTKYYTSEEPELSTNLDSDPEKLFYSRALAEGEINGKVYEHGKFLGCNPTKEEDGFWYLSGEKCDGEVTLVNGSINTYDDGILVKSAVTNSEGTTITIYADNDITKISSILKCDTSDRVTLLQIYNENNLTTNQNLRYDGDGNLTGFDNITSDEPPVVQTYEILDRNVPNGSDTCMLVSKTENEKTIYYIALSISDLPTKTTVSPIPVTVNNMSTLEGVYNNKYYIAGRQTPDEYSENIIFLKSIDYDISKILPSTYCIDMIENIKFSDGVKSDINILKQADALAKEAKEQAISEGKTDAEAQEIYQTTFDNSVQSQMVKNYTETTLSNDAILLETTVGDVIEKSDGLYVNDGNTLAKLSFSKEKYLELFPVVERFAASQGGMGDCYFVSSILSACFTNTQTYAHILKMFNVDESNNVTLTFKGSLVDYPVTFTNGELFTNDGMVDGEPVESPVSSQASGCLAAKYIEQAFAVARFASWYHAEISSIDIDAAYECIANGGDCEYAINEIIQSDIAILEMTPKVADPEKVNLITDEQMSSITEILTRYLEEKDKIETIEHSLFDGVIEGEVISHIQNMHIYCPEIWAESIVDGNPSATAFREYLNLHHKGAETINSLLTDEQICTLITKINNLSEPYADLRNKYEEERSRYKSINSNFTAETIAVRNVALSALLETPKESLDKIKAQGMRKTLEEICESSTEVLFAKFDNLANSVNSGDTILCAGTQGENYQYYIVNNHAYSIIGINTENKTIKIVNPWSCSTAIDVPYINFAEKFRKLHTADLNNLVTIDNGVDQFGKLWQDRKLYTGDYENSLYRNGVIDRTTQVYEGNNRLYVNGTIATGTQDFEGKLYTNGDLDKTKQLYKNQLWANGELSKDIDTFEGLTYYNGDLANGDIGNDTYSYGLLIRRKNEDNITTVNTYDKNNNIEGTRVHDENGNVLSIISYTYDENNILQSTFSQTNITYDSLTGKISHYTESIISTNSDEDTIIRQVYVDEYYKDADNNKKMIYHKIEGSNTTYYEKNETQLPYISTQDILPIFMDGLEANGTINGVKYSSGSLEPVTYTDAQLAILSNITTLDTNMSLSFTDIKSAVFTNSDANVVFHANGYIWYYQKTTAKQTLYAKDSNKTQVYYGTFNTSDNSKIQDLKINDEYLRDLNFLYSLDDDILAQYADINTLKQSDYTDSYYVDFDFSPKVREDINILKAADIAVKTDTTGTISFGNKVNELTIKDYSIAEAEIETKAGEVFTIGDALYVNDGEKMMPLKMTKEQYLELFPTLGRYAVSQGGYGDCYFISGVLLGGISNPISYAQLLQMMNIDQTTGDITVTFKGIEDYPVTFEKGELFKTDYRGSSGKKYDTSKSINTSKGMHIFEQAFALAKFAQKSSATVEAKDLDIDDALDYIDGGVNNEAQNAIFGEDLGATLEYLVNYTSYNKSVINEYSTDVKNYWTAVDALWSTEESAGLEEYKNSDIIERIRDISYYYNQGIDDSKNIWEECIVDGRASTEKLTELLKPLSEIAPSIAAKLPKTIEMFNKNNEDFQKIALALKNKQEYMAQTSTYVLANNAAINHITNKLLQCVIMSQIYDHNQLLNDIDSKDLYTALINDQNSHIANITSNLSNGSIIFTASTKSGKTIDTHGQDAFITDGHAYMIWSMDKDKDEIVISNPWQGSLTTTITFADFTKYFYQIYVAETDKIPKKGIEVTPLVTKSFDNVVNINESTLYSLAASSPATHNEDIPELVYYESENRRILYSIGEGDGARYYMHIINEESIDNVAIFVSSQMSDDEKELANGYIDGKEYIDGVLQPEE